MDNLEKHLTPVEWEVVSTYTDAQAVEDGVLVAISKTDRVTAAAFEYLRESMPVERIAADLPVELLDARRDCFAVGKARLWLAENDAEARRVWEQNIDGGIFKLHPNSLTTETRDLWIVPNEVGGLTLMFPEDY